MDFDQIRLPLFNNPPITRTQQDECEVCKNQPQDICRQYEQVRNKAISANMLKADADRAVNEICACFMPEPTSQTTLRQIAAELISYQNNEVKAFLTDVNKKLPSQLALDQNISLLTADLDDAWKVVYQARCTGVQNCNEKPEV